MIEEEDGSSRKKEGEFLADILLFSQREQTESAGLTCTVPSRFLKGLLLDPDICTSKVQASTSLLDPSSRPSGSEERQDNAIGMQV